MTERRTNPPEQVSQKLTACYLSTHSRYITTRKNVTTYRHGKPFVEEKIHNHLFYKDFFEFEKVGTVTAICLERT